MSHSGPDSRSKTEVSSKKERICRSWLSRTRVASDDIALNPIDLWFDWSRMVCDCRP
jgi:hypothetical protein